MATGRSKKLRMKLYFDRKTEQVEYITINIKGVNIPVKGLIVEEIGGKLPIMQNTSQTLEEREATLTIHPKAKIKKGQITINKK